MNAIARLSGAMLLAGVMMLGLPAVDVGPISPAPAEAGSKGHATHRAPIRKALHRQIHRVEHRQNRGVGNPNHERHLLRRDRRWLRQS